MSCPYFVLNVGEISLPGHYQTLRLPVCRCTLTETLVERLRTHAEGGELASHLEGTPQDGLPCSVLGSDLQRTSRAACTDKRRRESCLPHFVATLAAFGLNATITQ